MEPKDGDCLFMLLIMASIIEGKDKYSARIAVLEEFIRAAKASLSQREHH